MSLEAWKVVLCADIRDHTKKVVLYGMANHAHPDGTNCYPSITRLSIYTGLTERSVTRTIAELIEDGLVRRIEGGHRGSWAGYELNMHALSALHHKRIDRETGRLLPAIKADTQSAFAPSLGSIEEPMAVPGARTDVPSRPKPDGPSGNSRQPTAEASKADSDAKKADSDVRKPDGPSAYPSSSESNLQEKPEDSARPSDLAPGPSRDQTLYVQALAVLQGRLPKQEFVTWVQPTEVAEQSVKDGTLNVVLAANNPLHAKALRRHLPAIEKAMTEVAHKSVTLWVKE